MKNEKDRVLLSMKNAAGHIEGIIKMIESDRNSIDISNQILAAQGHLKRANIIILKQNMQHCLQQAIFSENEHEKEEEIMKIFKKTIKINYKN